MTDEIDRKYGTSLNRLENIDVQAGCKDKKGAKAKSVWTWLVHDLIATKVDKLSLAVQVTAQRSSEASFALALANYFEETITQTILAPLSKLTEEWGKNVLDADVG